MTASKTAKTAKMGWLGLAAAIAGGVFACSGSNSGGVGGADCLQQSVSSACYSCVQSHCASQLSNYEGSCTGYISCVCPGGTYDACNVASCSTQITTSGACQGDDLALQQCGTASCASECETVSGSGSGGTCTGSSRGTTGSSSGTTASSSGGSSGSSSGGTAAQCLQSSSTSACYDCVTTSCASQFAAFVTGCSAYIDCVCPGGVYDANDVTMCQSLEMATTCTSVITPLGDCETSSCASACTSTSSSSSGG